jgi:hypothetical protein
VAAEEGALGWAGAAAEPISAATAAVAVVVPAASTAVECGMAGFGTAASTAAVVPAASTAVGSGTAASGKAASPTVGSATGDFVTGAWSATAVSSGMGASVTEG